MKALTKENLEALLAALPTLPEGEQRALLRDLERYEELKSREDSSSDFLIFVRRMWPGFISGRHHKIMAKAFERVARGEIKRLIINMPPRHTKSEFASYLLPAWFLGKFPEKKVIQASHTAELAVNFGRKVRNLVEEAKYRDVFPDTVLQIDSKAAGRWNTSKGGDYFAIGVGGAVTGKGADLLIIDDPHSEQEATIAEFNPEIYDRTYEWYTSGPRQRLQPGGAIIMVMCMTGDTNVLMADGATTRLKDIRPGDIVATFDKGRLATAKVNNWRSSGVDSIYKIQTQSGIILRANERHPFLVMNEGVLEWTRLKNLKLGMLLVSTKDAADHHGQKPNPDCVTPVKQGRATTEKIQTLFTTQSATMGNGKEKSASVETQLKQRGCVVHATPNNSPQQNRPRSKAGLGASNTGTELLPRTLFEWLTNAAIGAMSAVSRPLPRIQGRIGTENFASTTAMTQAKSGGYFATTATSQLDMERQQVFLNELRRISDFTADPIVSITPAGEAEVFDVEVDRTENFVANGVVSHNTRWSKRDLTAQVLKTSATREGEEWEVIDFPAIMPSGKPLWPEFWPLEELEVLRNELPVSKWQAQYMQNPTSEASAIIKRDWWKVWEDVVPPQCEFVLMSWDTAFEKGNRADYSACTVWGIFYQNDDGSDPNTARGERGLPQANIILLNAFRDRMEFPELKRVAIEQYNIWEPDGVIIEKKASGAPLIYELRAMGILAQEFTPSRGNDKIARVNAIADIFSSGRVWAPETRWADEVIEEVASFPGGEHDDYVDSVSMAMMRFRQGGYVRTTLDMPEEEQSMRHKNPHQKPYY